MEINVKTNASSPNGSAHSKLFPEVRVSVKAVANERHELLIDGRKYSGGELINGKRINLKREGNNLVFEVEDEAFAEIENFYDTEAASLDGLEWQFADTEGLKFADLGVVADGLIEPAAVPLALLGASGLGGAAAAAAGVAGLAAAAGGGGGGTTPGTTPQANALAIIQAFATANGGTEPTAQDYIDAGVVGVTGGTSNNLGLINSVLAGTPVTGEQVNSTANIQAIANAVAAVLTGAAGGAGPTQAQLVSLGISGLTESNLQAVLAAINGTADDGSGVNTLDEIQALVNNVVNATPPAPTSYVDNAGSIQSGSSTAATTDDGTPGLRIGALPAGSTGAVLYVDGAPVAANYDPVAGTLTPNTPLGGGSHSLTYTLRNAAGVETARSPALTLTVDTTAPAAPGTPTLTDNEGSVTGPISSGGSTDDRTPTFTGTGTPGDTITLTDGSNPGTVIGTATVDPNGIWSVTPTNPLGEGPHSITTTATDPAGNTSLPSTPVVITVDTNGPATAGLGTVSITDNVGAVVGAITNTTNNVTDDNTPTVSGTGASADVARVNVYDTVAGVSTLIGTATVTGGNWSFTPTRPLTGGAHSITVRPVDASGNEGAANTPTAFTVDTPASLNAPAITQVLDNVGSVQGNVQPGGSTDDPTLTLQGTGAPGATITVYDGTTVLGTATVDANGQWSLTTPQLTNQGTHELTAVMSQDGVTSPASGVYPITLDTTRPATPGTPTLTDNVAPQVGTIAPGGSTDDRTPTFTGTGTPGDTITVTDGANPGTVIGTTTVGPNGTWSVTPTTPLGDGPHSITTTATDPTGNTSLPSTPVVITVDTSAVLVSIDKVLDNAGSVQGNVADGGVTDDTTPTLVGTATPFAVVTIKEGTTVLGTATADANGAWSFTVTTTDAANSSTAHTYTAEVPAQTGRTNTASFTVTLDTQAPSAPGTPTTPAFTVTDDVGSVQGPLTSGSATDDTTPTLTGTGATPGQTIRVYDTATSPATLVGSAVVNPDGSWSVTLTGSLGEGTHTLQVSTTDTAGNESARSTPAFTLTVDTTAPALTMDVVSTNNIVNLAEKTAGVTVSGTSDAETGQMVTVVWGSTTKTASVGVDGRWSVNFLAADIPADAATTTVSATVHDNAGNSALTATTQTVKIDTAPPTVTLNNATANADNSLSASELNAIPSGGSLTLTGTSTAEQNQQVTLTLNNRVYTGTVDAQGQWAVDVLKADITALAHGNTYAVKVDVSDAAGNPGRCPVRS